MAYGIYAEQRGHGRDGTRSSASRPLGRTLSPSGDFVAQVSESIDDFADVWPALADLEHLSELRSFPFQCRDHLQIWQETIGAARKVQPVFVTVTDAKGAPLMMIPLGIRTRTGVRVLSYLDEGIADYNAPVLYRAASEMGAREAAGIWDAICRAAPPFDVAILEKMPSAVAEFSNPLATLARKPWPISGHKLELNRTGSTARLQSGHTEKESRRRRRRLAEIGPVSFNIANNDDDAKKVFDVFVRQKLQRYRETIGMEDFDVPGQRAYYLTLTRRQLGGNVQLSWLAVGEDIVATAWCLSAGRQFYYMMCASERNDPWRSFSPGRLLLEELVHWAGSNGFEVFDFGIGDEDYKLAWRQMTVPLFSTIDAKTAKGRAWCTVANVRKELKQRLPGGLVDLTKRMLGRKTMTLPT